MSYLSVVSPVPTLTDLLEEIRMQISTGIITDDCHGDIWDYSTYSQTREVRLLIEIFEAELKVWYDMISWKTALEYRCRRTPLSPKGIFHCEGDSLRLRTRPRSSSSPRDSWRFAILERSRSKDFRISSASSVRPEAALCGQMRVVHISSVKDWHFSNAIRVISELGARGLELISFFPRGKWCPSLSVLYYRACRFEYRKRELADLYLRFTRLPGINSQTDYPRNGNIYRYIATIYPPLKTRL